MTLQEFTFTSNNHFIAIEQHTFFSKSVYLVLITKNYLIGLELNKGLSTESTDTLFTQKLPNQATPRGTFQNPYSYLKEKYVRQIEKKYLFDQSIFAFSKNNFRIDRNDVQTVRYEATKIKNFNYPHAGQIHIKSKAAAKSNRFNLSRNTTEKALIVMGEQDAKEIVNSITTRAEQLSVA